MNPRSVLIAGCGYLGTRLAQAFLDAGAESVYALRRSGGGPDTHRLPEGAIQVLADLTRPETLKPLPVVDAVVLCQAPGRHDDYEKTYLLGTKNLLAALEGSPRLVLVSSTSVYSTMDGSWVDESVDPQKPGGLDAEAAKRAGVLLKAEQAVLSARRPGMVVRSSGIYGPYRNRIQAIAEGRFVPELSEEVANRIRVEDLARAVMTVMQKGEEGQIYIASDDEPVTQREFYEWLYAQIKLPLPTNGSGTMKRSSSNKRCRNAKLKSLGWAPVYPSYREGYTDLMSTPGSPLSRR